MTDSMKQAISETTRRRKLQVRYNEENHITPQSISKAIDAGIVEVAEADYWTPPLDDGAEFATPEERQEYIAKLEKEMRLAAQKFEFERAAVIRDRIRELKQSEALA
jgi:excinuclease ABC subunit B